MYHLNQLAKKEGGLFSFFELFNPEMYLATNLQDYHQNRGDIKPTNKWLPIGVFINGCAIVDIKSSVQYESIDNNSGQIHDLSSSIKVGLYSHPIGLIEEQLEALVDGKKLFMPTLKYRVDDGLLWLIDYREHELDGEIEKVNSFYHLIRNSI